MNDTQQLAHFEYAAQSTQLQRIRTEIRAVAAQCRFSQAQLDQIVLAVNEACANIILHAYRPEENGSIDINIVKNESQLTIQIRDYADPADQTKIRSRSLDDIRPGGLGVYLMRESMDEVEFALPADGKGNLLLLRKNIT